MLFGTSGAIVLALQVAGAASADAAVKVGRSAQERFEVTRRAHLPRLRATGGRPCDAIVGRYCYWYDSTESKPIPEPPRIATARRTLVRLLDSLAARNPANDWITGQRVRYTIEEGDPQSALRAARSCAASGWWCAALEGLTHHVAERYAAADTAFGRALALMPEEQRCDWTDLRRLVAHTMTSDFRDLSCVQRRDKAERLWKVSQPLWSVVGNDLRTEHFARHTMAMLLARSANPHGMAWSSDSRELVIRYGWSEWFSRAEPSVYQTTPGGVTGHDREPSYFVFPRTTSTRARIEHTSWALRDATMPSRYSPRHIEWLGELSHQLVRFPHGDSMRVLAIARVRDSALAADSIELTLGALLGEAIATSRGRPVATLDVPNDSMLVSVEAVGTKSRRAERARYSVAALPCARRCLSDLLLFSADGADNALSLDSAMRRAWTGGDISTSSPLGVYWEVGDGAHADVLRDSLVWASITVEPERISAARRLAARARIASLPTAVKLRWRLPLSRTGSVTLRLPGNARGRYRVRLSIDGVGSSERRVTLQ
jgi:hypothetical protein